MPDKERFIDNHDGTITDSTTGLLWMQQDAWQKEAKWFTWDEAIELANYFNAIKFGGFQDWRLPIEEEIKSLYHEEAINQDKYGNILYQLTLFWCG